MVKLLILGAIIIAAPFVLAAYFRFATKQARRADGAWTSVEQSARILLEDRHLSPRAGDIVEFLVNQVGTGMFSGLFLIAVVFGKRNGKRKGPSVFDELNEEQEERFLRFIIQALFYDSLRSPIVGTVMRRVIYWLAATASDKKASINRYEVVPAVVVAGRMAHT